MSIGDYVHLCIGVISDVRVIATAICMIFIMEFAKYITTYTKKPPKPKASKAANATKAPEQPAKEEKPAQETPEDGAAE